MKYIIMSLLITLFCINFSFAQNGPASREIISGSSSSGSSFSSSYKEIRSRTARDAKLNKLDNDINYYRSKDNNAARQKEIELQREKSKIINIK